MKTFYYSSFDEDMTVNPGQARQLPEDWRIVRDRWWERGLSAVLYNIFTLVSRVYLRFGLHVRFVGRDKLLRVPRERGYIVFANHTQPFGDPLLAIAVGRGRDRRRSRAVCAPSNFGLPVLGPLLPYLGGIPTASSRGGLRKLEDAVSRYCDRGEIVVIFPEAHVWPYCTCIRPFGTAAFHYPVSLGLPSFAMTVTYQSRGEGRRPRAAVYVDGPFWPDESLPPKQRKERLRDQVRLVMEVRSQGSNCQYVHYQYRP